MTDRQHALGDRVRTLIHLHSDDSTPEQPDIPAGSLGTVDSIHHDSVTGRIVSYGVMLDAAVNRLSAAMKPGEIEAVGKFSVTTAREQLLAEAAEASPDATERALWQALADAIQHLEDWGLMPLATIADQLGGAFVTEIDAGPVIHGAAVRPPGGYLLRYQPGFTPDPDRPGHDLPSGWQVVAR
ncbi:hypothetical protein [Kitasatospora sp. NPDC002965]|uniref:hypothetical protein n=1 Tax=Kitasatospora sp. NPDC002965 TaxID=3154775 RepID=UPI0033BF923D